MIPISMEPALRDFDLFVGNSYITHCGPCARDLQTFPRDCVTPVPSGDDRDVEPEFVIERYVVGVNGEMAVFRGNEQAPLSFSVLRGYCFEI